MIVDCFTGTSGTIWAFYNTSCFGKRSDKWQEERATLGRMFALKSLLFPGFLNTSAQHVHVHGRTYERRYKMAKEGVTVTGSSLPEHIATGRTRVASSICVSAPFLTIFNGWRKPFPGDFWPGRSFHQLSLVPWVSHMKTMFSV